MTEPLAAAELAELAASIDHLSGPDAWADDRLEPMLIPVTHYTPRLLAEHAAAIARAETAERQLRLTTTRADERKAERDAARAELEQLRAGLRDEWATRDSGYIDESNIYATEAEAFAALYSGEDVVRRQRGDWIAVGGLLAADPSDGTAAGTALSGTESARNEAHGSFDGNTSSITPAGQTGACVHAQPCPVCDYDTEEN